jgi:hypothetical protein
VTSGRALFAVFGFDSTHVALKAEDALLAADLEVALIPTPRALGSLCGFAVRVPAEQRQSASAVLETARVDVNGVIEIEDRARR